LLGYGEKKDLKFHPNNLKRPGCGLAMETVFAVDQNIRIMFGRMILVVARQRVKVGGKPKWFKVNISSYPPTGFLPHWDIRSPTIELVSLTAPYPPWRLTSKMLSSPLLSDLSTLQGDDPSRS
jgi:hypothetical protein